MAYNLCSRTTLNLQEIVIEHHQKNYRIFGTKKCCNYIARRTCPIFFLAVEYDQVLPPFHYKYVSFKPITLDV
jgi:hypothetical protein